MNVFPISLQKKEFVIKRCFESFKAPHLHEKYQHLVKNEVIEEEKDPVRGFEEDYRSPSPLKRVKFQDNKEDYMKLTKSAEKRKKSPPSLEKLFAYLNKGEDIMTILKKPHYRDLALENRTVVATRSKRVFG